MKHTLEVTRFRLMVTLKMESMEISELKKQQSKI